MTNRPLQSIWLAPVAVTIVALVIAARLLESEAAQQSGEPAAEPAAAAKLAGPPAIAKVAGEWEVGFSLAAPSDVTVRIVDANGGVVRHLACGMVGLEEAAKPFVPHSLAQKLTWDGKDDAGKPVDAAGCKAWVGVGMRAKFDKFILWEKDGICGQTDIFAPSRGEYYITQSGGYHTNTTRIFDKEGKFVRCLWPYNLNQKGVKEFLSDPAHGADDWDGNRVPVSVNHNASYYYGTKMANAAITTDGYYIGVADWSVGSLGLNCVTLQGMPNQEGGWAYDAPGTAVPRSEPTETEQRKRPLWYKSVIRGGNRFLWSCAAGSAGDFYLADGISHVVARFRAKDFVQLPFAGTDKTFIGEVDQAADDETHFVGPNDIVVGEDGNIYVLDGADTSRWGPITITDKSRVKVYSKEGTFLKLLKADQFPKLCVPESVMAATKTPRALNHPHFLRVDPVGRLYVKQTAGRSRDSAPVVRSDIDGKSFKAAITLSASQGCDHGYHCTDSEGNWYVTVRTGRGKSDELWKFSPDGQRLSFGRKDAIVVEFDEPARGKTVQADIKGACVAPNGDIYVVNAVEKWTTDRFLGDDFKYGNLTLKGDKYNTTRVDVYGADGEIKRKNLVRSQGLNDVAVDREGNVYVIEATMYHGAHQRRYAKRNEPLPFAYLTKEQANLDPKTRWNKRFSLTARLMKFSPEGGVRDGEDGKPQLWSYAGVSGLSPQGCGTECPAGQICLDADERIWVPDTFVYCVKAVDKAGNEMIRVGKYGNEDCKGGGGDRELEGGNMVVDPEIPLARPSGMAVYKDWLFISDMYAHRVVRCRLTYADAKEVPVP